MSDTRDAITIRDYERRQLMEFLPDVIDVYAKYEDDAMVETRETFEELQGTFSQEIDGTESEYDIGAEQWRDVAMGLDELDETRASWLSAKIGRRADLSSIQMGFTTNVPFMALTTGEDPIRPE